MLDKKNQQKTTGFWSILENFWYYNKWKIMISLILLVIITLFVTNLINRPKYDITVIMAGNYPFVSYYDHLEEVLSSYAQDINNDGKSNVQIIPLIVFDELETDSPKSNSVNITKLTANLTLSDVVIYLVDDYVYNILNQQDLFMDLNELGINNNNISKTRYYIENTKIGNKFNLPSISNEFSFIMRKLDKFNNSNDSEILKYYQSNKDFLSKIIQE